MFCLTFIILFYAFPAFPEYSVKIYKEYKNDSEMDLYIQGLGKGFVYADAMFYLKHGKRLFCPPDNLVLEKANFYRILDDEILRTEKIDFDAIQTTHIEMLIGQGLKKTFPCKKTTKK